MSCHMSDPARSGTQPTAFLGGPLRVSAGLRPSLPPLPPPRPACPAVDPDVSNTGLSASDDPISCWTRAWGALQGAPAPPSSSTALLTRPHTLPASRPCSCRAPFQGQTSRLRARTMVNVVVSEGPNQDELQQHILRHAQHSYSDQPKLLIHLLTCPCLI
jgi:hypothetical protein